MWPCRRFRRNFMAFRHVSPISSAEFAQMLHSTRPPFGWSGTITVANSGGPDSTCLLFLLNRHFKEARKCGSSSVSLPERLVSLSIDHNLQPSSSKMSEHAGRNAMALGVEHFTAKLAWDQDNITPKPGPHEKFEEIARTMRYKTLFLQMNTLDANLLAMGHHIDDQVETMLMRLGRGSSKYGLAGMKPCRRWGMGNETERYGIEGMRKWIIRPLLSVGKCRILATCEENGLDYVHDPTNFQPQLTIRNAIRHIIRHRSSTSATHENLDLPKYPEDIAQQLAAINNAAKKDPDLRMTLYSGLEHLRNVNKDINSSVLHDEDQVDKVIVSGRVESPPGTFAISASALESVKSQNVREALLYRITRYVSPVPWGNPRAELGRRKASVQRLMERLWDFGSLKTKDNHSICVGSGVWWKPAILRKGRVRWVVKHADLKDVIWLALRQPNYRSSDIASGGDPTRLKIDITDDLLDRQQGRIDELQNSFLDILYDSRFLIHLELAKLPSDVKQALSMGGRLVVCSEEPWNLPRIVLKHCNSNKIIHSYIGEPPTTSLDWINQWGIKGHQDINSGWIVIEYFRSTSSI